MAALRLPCRTCVLSASPRLALDIFQARLARKAWAGDSGRSMFCWYAYRPGALGYFSLHPNSSEGRGSKDAITPATALLSVVSKNELNAATLAISDTHLAQRSQSIKNRPTIWGQFISLIDFFERFQLAVYRQSQRTRVHE